MRYHQTCKSSRIVFNLANAFTPQLLRFMKDVTPLSAWFYQTTHEPDENHTSGRVKRNCSDKAADKAVRFHFRLSGNLRLDQQSHFHNTSISIFIHNDHDHESQSKLRLPNESGALYTYEHRAVRAPRVAQATTCRDFSRVSKRSRHQICPLPRPHLHLDLYRRTPS